ncbi:hypothetical protein BH11BAC4_BH11BAC4_23150 [soil metagenome]
MGRKVFIYKCILILFISVASGKVIYAQSGNCVFKDTLFRIDFGNTRNPQEFNLGTLRNYERDNGDCPPDGFYSYSSSTGNCFNGDWITLPEDHTAGDVGGKMFFVNANPTAAAFFIATLSGFKPGTTYEFGVWMMNLCKINGGCSPLPPNILITLRTPAGMTVGSFQTGQISSSYAPSWKKYFAFFTTPAEATSLVLKMEDLTNGGCGNDFTMDDITVRECYKVIPAPAPKELKPEPKPIAVAAKPVIKEPTEELLKKDPEPVSKIPVSGNNPVPKEVTKIKTVDIPLAKVILSRENPVIKTIQTEPATMLIELYDNGQIDGDTVSIYHNNELVISHAGLSEKAISFKIKVDADHPHHELIMVADNLGSIPPNTSLMVITANKKRYEIFISSSEQKNAKLVIDLKQ